MSQRARIWFATCQTKRVSFIDAVVLAVSQQGGALRPVDLEDIAMEADTILPGRFRWKKYRDQVNLYAIRYAVKDAQGEQLLRGRAKTGWQLTPAGLARAEELSATMGERRVGTALTGSGETTRDRARSIGETICL